MNYKIDLTDVEGVRKEFELESFSEVVAWLHTQFVKHGEPASLTVYSRGAP